MRVIHVLRKPLSEGTVAANTLKHGTGGLNIDASRISTDDNLNGGAYAENPTERWDGAENWRYKRGGGRSSLPGDSRTGASAGMFQPRSTASTGYVQPSGRWPANVILQHLDGCRCEGTKPHRHAAPITAHGGFAEKQNRPYFNHTDKDGKETVANWICEPGCPVARLDEQSGILKSGALPSTQYIEGGRDNSSMFAGDGVFTHQGYKADTGGASRFYKQVGGKTDG